MHSRFTTVISVLLLASASLGQQQISHEEETIVRTAYAKLSYADEVRIVLDALEKTGRDKLWKSPANLVDRALSARLNFELSDFHFGNLNDIAKRKMSDFDGSPTQIGGQVLDVTPSIYNYARKGSNSKYVAYVKFAWKQSPLQSLLPAENWPIEKALQVQDFEGKKYNSYVTYTVTVTYQGQSRTYDTWMLYGRDDRGKPQIYFMDSVADPTAVTFAFEHSLYPAAFVETDLRSVPFVDKWLYDNALSCSAKHSEKDDDRIDVCCDPKSGRCGVAASSLVPRDSRLQLKPGSQLVPASFHFSPLPLHAIQSTPTDLCQQFNQSTTFPHGLSDIQEHSVGAHTFTATVVGNCAYTDQTTGSPGQCNMKCSAQSSSEITDFGSYSGLVFGHATAKTDSSGGDFSNGGTAPISCLGLSGGTVRSCFFSCSTTISVTAGGQGNLGATVSFPPSQLWGDQNKGSMTCQPRNSDPSLAANGCDPTAQSDFTTTQDQPTNCDPVVLALGSADERFEFTDAANGVKFDIRASGRPIQIPWTAKDSHTAFLALDRNHNGLVDDGSELFSNVSPQAPSPGGMNGFKALARYDLPELGGNGDGVLDAQDAIWPQLLLWIDTNHDGISQPGELHTLTDMGVRAISLSFDRIERRDDNGNLFLFRAAVAPNPDARVSHHAYDVFFVTNDAK